MLRLFSGGGIALAIGGDTVWFAKGSDGSAIACPAYVASAGSKVLAVGDEALRMLGKEPGNIQVTRITRHGGFGDDALAAAFLRYLIRKNAGTSALGLPPRAIAACAEEAKVRVRNVAVHAGVREVLTISPVMAAAIGAGLAIEEADFKAVFVLERDWCGFGLISLAGLVASFSLDGGVELLLEDLALQALATHGVALDLDSLHAVFQERGLTGGEVLGWDAWIGELETGRPTVLNAQEVDFRRGSLPFTLRLAWRYQRAMEAVTKAKRRDSSVTPLCFAGSYARTPGVADLVAKAFQRQVTVPEKPELAMIRGAQTVIKDLGFLLKHFKPPGKSDTKSA